MGRIQKMRKKAKKKEKKIKLSKIERTGNLTRKKRMRNAIIAVFLVFSLMAVRIGWIQFVDGDKLKYMAYVQHTLDRKINPKRGTIYDATGSKVLAVSSTVRTITVNPVNIKKEDKERVARTLSDIFNVDYDSTLKKVSKKTSIETIAKKVDKEQADELMKWMEDNNILTRN